MELLRRILFVLGLLGAAWAWIGIRPVLLSVAAEDFAESKASAERRPTGFRYRDQTLAEFHRRRTEGRTTRIDGSDWLAFHAAVAAATQRGAGPEDLLARRGEGHYARRLYYLPDEPPLDAFAPLIDEDRPLVYVSVGGEGPTARTLAVTHVDTTTVADEPPPAMLHPARSWAPWLALAGLAAYLLLPRRRFTPVSIRYARPAAIVLPDLLATALLLAFLTLPYLVATMNGGSLFDPGDGWWLLALPCALLALAPIAILGIATRNAAFHAHLKPDALVIHRLSTHRIIPCADVRSLRITERQAPTWIRRLAPLALLLSWRAALPTVMLHSRTQILELTIRDDRPEHIALPGLRNTDRLIDHLAHHGVPIPEDLRAFATESPAPARTA